MHPLALACARNALTVGIFPHGFDKHQIESANMVGLKRKMSPLPDTAGKGFVGGAARPGGKRIKLKAGGKGKLPFWVRASSPVKPGPKRLKRNPARVPVPAVPAPPRYPKTPPKRVRIRTPRSQRDLTPPPLSPVRSPVDVVMDGPIHKPPMSPVDAGMNDPDNLVPSNCGERKGKKFPNAPTKAELVNLVAEHVGITKSEANSKNKGELCGMLVEASKPPPPGNCKDRSLLPLKPHQQRIADYLDNHFGVLAAHATGTGKTHLAVTASQCFIERTNKKGRVIVITPPSLKENFKDGIKKYGAPLTSNYKIVSSAVFAKRENELYTTAPGPIMLIVDEAHTFRKSGTAINGALRFFTGKLAGNKQENRVLLLTATPVVDTPADLRPLLSFLGIDSRPDSLDTDSLAKLGCVIDFAGKSGDDFPEVIEMTHKIKGPKGWGPKVFSPKGPGKQAPVRDIIKDAWSRGEKVLVFGTRRAQFDQIPAKFKLDGSIPAKKRAAIAKEFSAKNDGGVLVTTSVGVTGLDFKGIRHIVFMTPSKIRKQIIGRGARFRSHAHLPEGQRNVTIHHMMTVHENEKVITPDMKLQAEVDRIEAEFDATIAAIDEANLINNCGFGRGGPGGDPDPAPLPKSPPQITELMKNVADDEISAVVVSNPPYDEMPQEHIPGFVAGRVMGFLAEINPDHVAENEHKFINLIEYVKGEI